MSFENPESVQVKMLDKGWEREKRQIIFESPSRRLLLELHKISDNLIRVFSYLSTIVDRDKIEGETAALYRKANEFMQQEANTSHCVLVYTFSTNNIKFPKLAEWGRTTANEIFHWDSIDDNPQDPVFGAHKRYQPQLQ